MVEHITVDDAARVLGVGRVTVLRYCRSGKLLAWKVSNRWRIDKAKAYALRASWGRP
jgi:excisionase family DNA binding protein